MKRVRSSFIVSGVLFLVFVVFTIVVMKVDVRPIGPDHSSVGLATINQFVFAKLGVNLLWYHITDWLGVVAILVALGFAVHGLMQLIRRRILSKVDADIILLGLFYIIVVATYVLFEIKIVNYRPIILYESLEASFPSSHTMIVLCIMGTAMIQFHKKIKSWMAKTIIETASAGIIVVTIGGRLVSGVHWFTDIVAGVLLGTALVMLYYAVTQRIDGKQDSSRCGNASVTE